MRAYKAPFYFNIKFYQNSQTNQNKNSAHIRYIATRPGVDLGHELNKDMELQPDTAAHHVKYAHERPRSHGLFGAGNEEINMFEVQKELMNHQGMVWRIIISLHGEDAERLDMDKRDSWEEVIKQQLPRAAAEMGIAETNLNWVAAYHAEVGHPHAHIVMWEKKPKRRMGKVTPHVKNQMRKKFVQKIYSADRDRYGKEKTAMRDMIRDKGIVTLREAVNLARDLRNRTREVELLHNMTGQVKEGGILPKPEAEQIKHLVKKLEEISKMLPKKGRIMMKFMPENVKDEIRKLAEWLYNQSQFGPLKAKYEQATEMLARPYSQQADQITGALDRAREDIINRISQGILKAASEIDKTNQFSIHPDKAKEVVEKIKLADGHVANDLPNRLGIEILKRIVLAGIPIEYCKRVLDALKLNISPNAILAAYKSIPEQFIFNKGIAYILKATIGHNEADVLLRNIGHSERDIKLLQSIKKTPIDYQALSKVFKVPDHQYLIVQRMAKVLMACGVSAEEAKRIILGWNLRSNSNISEDLISKILKTTEKVINEARDWGRNTLMTKKDFNKMCESLNIKTQFPWRSVDERNAVIKGNTNSVATRVFKSALNQLSAAFKKSDAEREHAQLQAMNKIKRDLEKEQDEKERGSRGR